MVSFVQSDLSLCLMGTQRWIGGITLYPSLTLVCWHYHCCHANSDLALSASGLAIKRWMNRWMDGTKAPTRLIWPVIIWLESKERLLDLHRLFTGPSPPPYVRGLFCQKENPLALSIVSSS